MFSVEDVVVYKLVLVFFFMKWLIDKYIIIYVIIIMCDKNFNKKLREVVGVIVRNLISGKIM